jgi:hypothetical protein
MPNDDIIVTIGFPKPVISNIVPSLQHYGFKLHNLANWIDFKLWLFTQKDIRAMMKSEPNTVEFIVNKDMHPGTSMFLVCDSSEKLE